MEKENAGQLVMHKKTKRRGRIFYAKGLINGKVPVYFETEKDFIFEKKASLCALENLIVIGYID